MCTNIILLFSLALDKTYAVLKISFATMPHALGPHMGSDKFHFVVFFCMQDWTFCQTTATCNGYINATLWK